MQWIFKFFKSLRHERAPVQTVVVGIGNVGRQYSGTRHNVGFEVVEALAGRLNDNRRFSACHADIVTGQLASGHFIACAKAHTYVNRTGVAAKELLNYFNVDAARCIVVVDDFNLPLGKLRVRKQGSDGGHNGLKSLIGAIGKDFPRIRVGIGPVPDGVSAIDFVLGPFEQEQREQKEKAIEQAVGAVVCFCDENIETAMNRFN